MSQHPPRRQPPPLAAVGPVRLTPAASTALRPAPVASVRGGFWGRRREANARVGIPQGPDLLEAAGNLHDLRLAAGTATGAYQGDYPFMDSDVYKWLEAASWQLAQAERAGEGDGAAAKQLGEDVDRIIGLVAEAQRPDGYLNTWFQVTKDGRAYQDLRWGHELYCAGHLIQAAVAHHRATGREELLRVAVLFADNIDSVFGPDKPIDGFDAHPEVETALVELFRETGERRYLRLALHFVDRHGHGVFGRETYCQDRVPLREAENVEGHAVRQLYLLAAAADLAAETGEAALREACARLWEAMVATKTHLTGGLGAHHDKEEFGDPFELPNERAYCETCAAVASVQWGWRMALLTGEARYSDLIERTLYNGLLAGVSLDGERWLYVNPLQVRDGHIYTGDDKSARRTRWFRCACCPPNVMRLLAGLEHYMATTDDEGVQLHQYATGTYGGERAGEALVVSVNTPYPYQGRITVTVDESPADLPWTLSLRIPRWSARTAVRVDGQAAGETARDGWLRLHRCWTPGTEVVVDLDVTPRLTAADPRVDAVRGSVAIERGPLVYCLEQADHPGGGLDDIVIDTSVPLTEQNRPDLLGGVVTVRASGRRRDVPDTADWWPYRDVTAGPDATADRSGRAPGGSASLALTAVPYHAWANRADGAMRVWLPTT
ncbi:beta-L-arabinofuranosidase domain-containing protein [Streptomyces sp. NPDC051976]|uniref:glycoside hydrolase family 127 protein n=1 Tax=Streptomyces sp. NPDC051976 TaxID=3154947 RepID=UPI0034150B64